MLFRLINQIDDLIILLFFTVLLPRKQTRQAYYTLGHGVFIGFLGKGCDPVEIYSKFDALEKKQQQKKMTHHGKNKRKKKKHRANRVNNTIKITVFAVNSFNLKCLMIRVKLLRWALFLRGPLAWLFVSALTHCVRTLLYLMSRETVVSNNGENVSFGIERETSYQYGGEYDFAKILELAPTHKYSHYHCKAADDNRSFIYGPTGSTGFTCL